MFRERGIVIHAEDCVNDYWADRLTVEGLHLNVVGVHPAGGHDAHQTMEQAIRMLSTAEWAKFAGRMEKAGIAVEFEMHALSWMLEREKFAAHPHWFRTDENGNRTAQFNCCVSEPEALDYIRERACALSRIFVPDTNKYYFWIDDVASAGCQCEKCRALTPADQCMILTNAIAEGLEAGRPGAKQSYLAYCATLTPPKIVPRHNVFLEYAPIQRDHDRPLNDPGCTKNAGEIATLPALLDFFGKKDAKVLAGKDRRKNSISEKRYAAGMPPCTGNWALIPLPPSAASWDRIMRSCTETRPLRYTTVSCTPTDNYSICTLYSPEYGVFFYRF